MCDQVFLLLRAIGSRGSLQVRHLKSFNCIDFGRLTGVTNGLYSEFFVVDYVVMVPLLRQQVSL